MNTEKHILNKKSSSDNNADFGKLSPIGMLQQYANNKIGEIGKPGVMYTPFAIMMDKFAGWLPPRFSYTKSIYQAWGNLKYNNGDYQTHALFEMLYPGYLNAGYSPYKFGRLLS